LVVSGSRGVLVVLLERSLVVHVRKFGYSLGRLIHFSFVVVVVVERPATERWPQIFDRWPVFVTYPYLLPCAVAAVITLLGKQYEHGLEFFCRPQQAVDYILSLFLGRDGGSRESVIHGFASHPTNWIFHLPFLRRKIINLKYLKPMMS
jgi:hypothetical protein